MCFGRLSLLQVAAKIVGKLETCMVGARYWTESKNYMVLNRLRLETQKPAMLLVLFIGCSIVL